MNEQQEMEDEIRGIIETWWDTHPLNDCGWIPLSLLLAQNANSQEKKVS